MIKKSITFADLDARGDVLTDEELAGVSGGVWRVTWRVNGQPAEWKVVQPEQP
ncbi:hypothetical protein [Kineococcus sp. SYSU DK002]|uniref:hypothetical protein n=1 Tax=Kineococcus sp. SYSU DK002 TaxID=3383123 RepID=UPI003D7C8A3C